ncbi:MAG: cache domain-containing protein [Verrucomicrobiota bacterium]
MKTPLALIVMTGLVLSAAMANQQESPGADTPAQPNAAPGRLIDIKVALSGLTALADCPIQSMANALSVVAGSAETQSLDWDRMKPLLAAVQERFGPASVWFARPDGSYFSVDKGLTGKNLKDRPYFARVMAGESSIGELVVSRSTDGNTVITAVPVKKDGKSAGVLGASVYLDKLAQNIKKATPLPDGVVFYALDSKGQVALHSQEERIFQEATQLGSPSLTAAVHRMLADGAGVVTYEFEGRQQKAIFQTSPLTGWKFVIRFPADR